MGFASGRVLRGVLCVALGGICWGFSGTCAQLLTAIYGVPVSWVICLRLAGAALMYLVACLVANRQGLVALLRDRRSVGGVFVFSLLGVLLVQVCYVSCISHTNSGTATVFERMGLIIIMLFTCITMRRRPLKRELLAVVMALVGAVCIATKGNLGSLSISSLGLLWGMGSAVSLAFYTLLPEKLLNRWGSLPVTSLAMVFAAIVANAAVQPWTTDVQVTPEIVAAMIAMIVFGTFCAYLLFLHGLKDAGPMLAGLVGSIEPVAATVISALWLGTYVGPFDIAGCALIVVMVFLVTQRDGGSGAVAPAEDAGAAVASVNGDGSRDTDTR